MATTCIHVPDRWRLAALRESPDLRRGEIPWLEGRPDYERLYFGVEFCQHLIPEPEDLSEALDFAAERGFGFTLLTPYCTDAFVERVAVLLDQLEEAGAREPEVVVNDWGVLRRLRAEHPRLRPVLGRGLNRMNRDPRLPDVGPEHLGGDAPPERWRQASHDSRGFRGMLADLGVNRAETDVPLQGLVPPAAGSSLALSVHLPWGMVASGRICLLNSWGKSAGGRFVAPRHCDAPCRDFVLELRAPWARRSEGAQSLPIIEGGAGASLHRRRNALPSAETDPAPRFFQKGNTHFYRLVDGPLASALRWADDNPAVDRLVVEPDIPM